MIFDAIETKNRIINWIRDFFEQNGKDCNAVVGISGGTDSSVVAALCVEALGKDRVFGVLMPNGKQKDISDARKLVDFLDIKSVEINISDAVKGVLDGIKYGIYDNIRQGWSDIEVSKQTRTNLPPRIRMATLYAVSQSMNGRVANTCNLSEDWVGYSTRYGDSVGDFSPLSSLTKTEVVAVGKALRLPDKLVYKVPADGLCGKTDEENLGFSYEVLDQYIRTGKIDNMETKEKIDVLHEKNMFKTLPMPKFDYEISN